MASPISSDAKTPAGRLTMIGGIVVTSSTINVYVAVDVSRPSDAETVTRYLSVATASNSAVET